MNILEKIRKTDLTKPFLFYFLVPYLAGLLTIAKAFYLPGCFGFDLADGAVLTAPNLAIWQSILRQGHFPTMNVFNNFGTPFLGDGFTLPLALQSWTFAFLPDPVAATINRFTLSFLTLIVLTLYFRRRFSYSVSSVCALLVFFTPGPFWSMASHHYQACLLWTAVLFLLQERFMESGSLRLYLAIYAAWLGTLCGLNLQLVVTLALYTGIHAFLLTGRPTRVRALLFLSAMLSSFIVYALDIAAFFRNLSLGQMIRRNYVMEVQPGRILSAILGGVKTAEMGDFNAARQNYHELLMYLSIPVLAAVFMGLYRFWKARDLMNLRRIVILGIIPTAAALIFQYFPKVYGLIPVMRSTDVTRFLWFSSLFLAIPAGEALENLKKGAWSFGEIRLFAMISAAVLALSFIAVPWLQIAWTYALPVVFLAAFFAASLTAAARSREAGKETAS